VPELSFGEVGEILHLLQEVEAAEIDLEWGDLRIQVRKNGASFQTAVAPASPQTTAAMPGPNPSEQPQPSLIAASPAPTAGTAQTAVSDNVSSDWLAVSAPMAGTFYRSPSPEEPVFAEVGDVVAVGDTVALLEVMKLFTELKAEVAGKVARIDVADGSMVEFDQPLVWIEPV